jgi:hypothetical protein
MIDMSHLGNRIPLDLCHEIFTCFGITERTQEYERWVKDDGFDSDDIGTVINGSPFYFIVDWKACLQEELEFVAEGLSQLGVDLIMEMNEEGYSGSVECEGRRATVNYSAEDDSMTLDQIFRILQSIVPPNIEFRESPNNEGSDTSEFFVLPKEKWIKLESLDKALIKSLFAPLT